MISGTLSFMRSQPGFSISNGWSQYFIVDNASIGLVKITSQEELEETIEVE